MQNPDVVPIGRMSMENVFNGHPRRRAPHGGAKLNSKEEERKKPSLKDFLGMTHLDFLGHATDDVSVPVKLLQKLVGTSSRKEIPEEAFPEAGAPHMPGQRSWQQLDGLLQPPLQPPLQPVTVPMADLRPHIDTRTNLEKYMEMKRQEARCHAQMCNILAPVYYPPELYNKQSAERPYYYPPSDGIHREAERSCWNSQSAVPQYQAQCNIEGPVVTQLGNTSDKDSRNVSTVNSRDPSQQHQNRSVEGLQLENPPAWFQHKSYMPQVPQYSHMTAPVPGAPFHPGFSYVADFKYYYNYYPADEYAGEIDGGHATAQEEAVEREQQRAEEIVSEQMKETAPSSTLKPIISSKKRLESGRAVPL